MTETDDPIYRVTLWPHRSLDPRAFRWLMLGLTVAFCVPLFAFVGTRGLWVVGLFILADLALTYWLFQLTYRAGRVRETLELWPSKIRVARREPNGAEKVWEANPYWVRVTLRPTRRVEDYLILSASGRDIELGAFLTPEERRTLAEELRRQLAALGRSERAD